MSPDPGRCRLSRAVPVDLDFAGMFLRASSHPLIWSVVRSCRTLSALAVLFSTSRRYVPVRPARIQGCSRIIASCFPWFPD